jgi:hypothetical protein
MGATHEYELAFRRALFQRAIEGEKLRAGKSYVGGRIATKADVKVVKAELKKWMQHFKKNPAATSGAGKWMRAKARKLANGRIQVVLPNSMKRKRKKSSR